MHRFDKKIKQNKLAVTVAARKCTNLLYNVFRFCALIVHSPHHYTFRMRAPNPVQLLDELCSRRIAVIVKTEYF